MAKKGAMASFACVDDYINNQSKESQIILHELRSLIKEVAPEAIELPNYKVPSFTLIPGSKPAQQLMIVAYAKHVSFYPFQATIDHFTNELKGFDLGKGTVKFKLNQPLPKELIKQMVAIRKDEIQNSLK
ncbi:DUF1801 domain-containing protein [Myroides sp. JBRI-B21084]|uniref:iron chaperone n=1 Tax=Myroides sp. JBRI-B21084 TaxID=3119977 RepID=UPI0026E430C5|nr:DUF1801 domain-containing protein [Paenimyroides cloacae]WKW46667.1 DUF1801 domain-containing protein [Paenimyroides cloacae]